LNPDRGHKPANRRSADAPVRQFAPMDSRGRGRPRSEADRLSEILFAPDSSLRYPCLHANEHAHTAVLSSIDMATDLHFCLFRYVGFLCR